MYMYGVTRTTTPQLHTSLCARPNLLISSLLLQPKGSITESGLLHTFLSWKGFKPAHKHPLGHGEADKGAVLDVVVSEGPEGADGLENQLLQGEEDSGRVWVGLGWRERRERRDGLDWAGGRGERDRMG